MTQQILFFETLAIHGHPMEKSQPALIRPRDVVWTQHHLGAKTRRKKGLQVLGPPGSSCLGPLGPMWLGRVWGCDNSQWGGCDSSEQKKNTVVGGISIPTIVVNILLIMVNDDGWWWLIIIWLVVSTYPIPKNDGVKDSWDDEIPNLMER